MKRLLIGLFLLYYIPLRAQVNISGIAATPPMGWNSYDCYGAAVTGQEVSANADYMAKYLKPFGWTYIVIDFCWFYPHPPGSKASPPQQSRLPDGSYAPLLAMDSFGRLLPVATKFPSAANGKGFKPLADYVHSLGLKFGIHIMRGIPRQAVWKKTPVYGAPGINAAMIADTSSRCSWLNAMYGLDMHKPGAQQYLNSLLKLYASWGVDFIKVDDISRPYHAAEIEGYAKAIKNCGRRIILSLSPGATPMGEAKHVMEYANQWRMADDFWDNWAELKHMFDLAAEWSPYSGPGHWPDLDMIPVGRISKRGPVGPERNSHFTPAEEKTLLTLWCITRSPLFLGGNLPENTPADNALETNSEVLAADQQGTGSRQLYRKNGRVAWVSSMPDKKIKNIAFFNLNDQPEEVEVQFSSLGIKEGVDVEDMWKRQYLGYFHQTFSQLIGPHGAGFFRVTVR